MSKVKSGKETVTVRFAWFSQAPTFDEVIKALNHEIAEKHFITLSELRVINKLLLLNEGQPFTGYSEFGPHTRIRYEAANLAEAVESFRVFQSVLSQLFPSSNQYHINFLNLIPTYAGVSLITLVREMENALVKVGKEIKETRSIFPNKKMQRIRMALERTLRVIHE